MGNKNIVTKQYISDNEKFADIFNYYIYHGKSVIKSETLQEKDPTELVATFTNGNNVFAKEKLRDVFKECIIKESEHQIFLLMGIEAQSGVHYAMAVRNGLYDFMEYASQVREKAKEHQKKRDLSGDEFLSGICKCDKIKPIITLTVYFGTDEWDGARSLHEMFETDNQEILKYVSDYKLNLLIPKEINDSEKFMTDFRYIVEYLKAGNDKEKLAKLYSDNVEIYSRLREDAAMVLKECAGAEFEKNEEEGYVNMCKGLQGIADDARKEGVKEKRKQDVKIINMVKEGMDYGEIAKECNVSMEDEEEQQEYADMCKGLQGIADDARKEGREEGRRLLTIEYYLDGDISLEKASMKCGMSKEKFLAYVEKYKINR